MRSDAKKFIKSLNPEEQSAMKNLLTKTWERHRKTHTMITSDIPKAKELTLAKDLLPDLERQDSWVDRFILSWDIIPNGWEESDSKTKILKIIAKHPEEW